MNHDEERFSNQVERLTSATGELAESIEDILISLTQFKEPKEKRLYKLGNAFYYFIQSHTKRGQETKRKILNITSKINAKQLDFGHNLYNENYSKLQQNIDELLKNLSEFASLDKRSAELISLSVCINQCLRATVNTLVFDSYSEVNEVIDGVENNVQAFIPKNLIEQMVYTGASIALLLLKTIQIYEKAIKIKDTDTKLEIFASISSSFEKNYNEISGLIVETESLIFDNLAHISLLWAIKVEESAYSIVEEKNDFEHLEEIILRLCLLYSKIANRLSAIGLPKAIEYWDKVLSVIESAKPSIVDKELSEFLDILEMEAKMTKLTISSLFSGDLNGIDKSITLVDEMEKKIKDRKWKNFLAFSKKYRILTKLWIQFFVIFQQKKFSKAKRLIDEILPLAEEIKEHPPVELPEEMQQDFLVTSSKKGEYVKMVGVCQINFAIGMLTLLEEKSKDIPNLEKVWKAKSYLEKSSEFSPELVGSLKIWIIAYGELANCYEKLGEKYEKKKNLEEAKSHFALAATYHKKACENIPIFTMPDAKSNLCNSKVDYIQALIELQDGNFKSAIQKCERCKHKIEETKRYSDEMKVLEFSDISPSQIINELEFLDQHVNDLKHKLNQKYGRLKRNLFLLTVGLVTIVIISNRYISGYLGTEVFREILIDVVFSVSIIGAVYKVFIPFIGKKVGTSL